MDYVPRPKQFNDIPLSEDIQAIMEQIAEDVHEMWAKNRVDEGWRYGDVYDGASRLHPCLIPYDQLPESEKDYDRKTAKHTIQFLLHAGFQITLTNKQEEKI